MMNTKNQRKGAKLNRKDRKGEKFPEKIEKGLFEKNIPDLIFFFASFADKLCALCARSYIVSSVERSE
jgi:hypothetical protein